MTTTSTSTSTTSTTSVANAIGVGSGIDIPSLVTSLVDAQYSTTKARLAAKSEALTAQISAAGTLKSNLSDFAGALSSLSNGGTLATQPTSSNSAILGVAAIPGAKVGALSATVEVRQLAAAQVSASAQIADRTAVVGTGSLTLTLGTATIADGAMTGFTAGAAAPKTIAITDANASLDGIAAAINAAGAGVTATVLSDSNGARLTLKSATGAAQAFTLSATEDTASPGLAALEVGVGKPATIGTAAADAVVAVDGIEFRRSSNTINNLITGVKLSLATASPGTRVTIGSTPPISALGQAVTDFVETYNQLYAVAKADADPITGSLRSDSAVSTILRSLSGLTLAKLVPAGDGTPRTLAEIGVATNRDGTLTVNTATLNTALTRWPAAVEAMFAPPAGGGTTDNGLSAALAAISTTAASTRIGLAASVTRFTAQQTDLTKSIEKADDDATAMNTRLTQQFSSMDSKVAAYKSTLSFLQAQIDAWNSDD